MMGGCSPKDITTGADQEIKSPTRVGDDKFAKLWGFDLIPDGTNAAELTIFDGPAASGRVLARAYAPGAGPSVHVRYTKPIAGNNEVAGGGLRASLTGTGAKAVILFE